MPPLLRKDSIRLLEAAVEALQLAISSLGRYKRVEFRQPPAEWAIEIGLIGTAVELAFSACLVQARGLSAIIRPSGMFKSAREILEDFRALVRDAAISSEFLVQGVDNSDNHRDSLLSHTITFRRLMPIRAAGFHAGKGVLHEAVVVQADIVSDFFELLANSSRIHPYLPHIPRYRSYGNRRTLIIEEIATRLREGNNQDKSTAISSLYLVLPDLPEDEPEWLSALQRLSVAPRARDITYLLNVLETALPANLRRAGGAGDILRVAVRQQDPDAVPIAPQFLRRAFQEIPELWHADIGIANGRLDRGGLDLPPVDTVREVFAIGLERSRILNEGDTFTAHQSWVHIAASLFATGTPGPYWFIVKRSVDLGQLIALLTRAGQNQSRTNRQRIEECTHGIQAIQRENLIRVNDPFFSSCIQEIRCIEEKKERVLTAFQRSIGTVRELPEHFLPGIESIAQDGEPIGALLSEVLESDESGSVKRYWTSTLASAAYDEDDLPALVTAIGTQTMSQAHTHARKAIRRIDFRHYGPPVG